MPRLLTWNLSKLHTKSRELTGPLPELYVRDLTRMVEELQGVYLSGIQCGDARRFAIPNPRFKTFPILYNPVIIDQYDHIKSEGEGCLSFPGLWVQIPRFKYVRVSFRDGNWQEKIATFGAEDQNTEEALLAKAIQHEIYHMQGVVIHERIKDLKKRLKASALIMKKSIEQNRTGKVSELVEGPSELDPNSLPIMQVDTSTLLSTDSSMDRETESTQS